MWLSRSRLNSARTVSESSEGCGTALDMDMNEDSSMAGSLKRRRHREDSAYVSQRDSLSGGPSETPSPEMENEDLNEYVLPGGSPERGDMLLDRLLCLMFASDCSSLNSFMVVHTDVTFINLHVIIKSSLHSYRYSRQDSKSQHGLCVH